jgi:hypothetical protein
MPDAQRLFRDLKRYETFDHSDEPGGWNASEVSHLAIDEMLEHGSCLVIVNTKCDALAIYTACKERLGYCRADRRGLPYSPQYAYVPCAPAPIAGRNAGGAIG